MIKQLFKIITCIFKNHEIVSAGSCPFTEKSYNACTRCGAMIAI
jgi:hypothetical protein